MNAQWIQFVFLSEKIDSVTRIFPSAYADKAIIFVTLFPSGFKDIPYVLLRFFGVEIAPSPFISSAFIANTRLIKGYTGEGFG
jgi:hypothetical protein